MMNNKTNKVKLAGIQPANQLSGYKHTIPKQILSNIVQEIHMQLNDSILCPLRPLKHSHKKNAIVTHTELF